MSQQVKKEVQMKKETLEWLYVPDQTYMEIDGMERKLQMIIPYQRTWEEDKKFPVVLFIPGAGWQRQEMYNDIPARAELAKRGFTGPYVLSETRGMR